MGAMKLTYDSKCDCWVFEPIEALNIRNPSSNTRYYSSSLSALSRQSLPTSSPVLQRSGTLAKPNHGSIKNMFKHFWTCVKPRIIDDDSEYSRRWPTAKKQQKATKASHDGAAAGSTKRSRSSTASTTFVETPPHVPSSPYSAMSVDVRAECLKEAILYCNESRN